MSNGADAALRREAAADVPSTCQEIKEKLVEMLARMSALSADRNIQHAAVTALINSHPDFRWDLKAVKATLAWFMYSLGVSFF